MPAIDDIRTLLLAPTTFFAEREPSATLPMAAGVVVVCVVVAVLCVLALPTILGSAIDGPITMDNPDKPPEWVCEQDSLDEEFDHRPENCDEPDTVERTPESLLREIIAPYAGGVAVALLFLWGVGTLSFYLMASLLGGTPSLGGTAALAGWAALPELVRFPLALLVIRRAVSDVTIEDPEAEMDVLLDAIGSVDPFLTVVTLFTTLWQWYIVSGGLERDAALSNGQARLAAGVPLALAALLAVL